MKKLPELPLDKEPAEHFMPEDFIDYINTYLQTVIKLDFIFKEDIFQNFIEISDYNHEGTVKVKESWVGKRAGGRYEYQNCCRKFYSQFNNWNKRYMVITSEGVMYSKSNKSPFQIREFLMFDNNFKLLTGKKYTGKEWGILLKTTSRLLVIKAYSFCQFVDLIASFLQALDLSQYTKDQRYNSFAPIRENAICKWYVDGHNYYKDLYEKLQGAKESVYITDWWLSPELHLLRPVGESYNQSSRIDNLLNFLASKGVKIYILIFREPKIALANDSEYTKLALEKHNKNIIVLRHPSTVLPFLWSHHEKIVIVDQEYGFLGGLDLCYGRYDTQEHLLDDPGSTINEETVYNFPGIDYSNVRIRDFTNVKIHNVPQISREKQPRMPWHDVQMSVVGEPVKDMTRHFIQYWNFAKVNIYSKDKKLEQLQYSEKQSKKEEEQTHQEGPIKSFFKSMINFKFFNKNNDVQQEPRDKSNTSSSGKSKSPNKNLNQSSFEINTTMDSQRDLNKSLIDNNQDNGFSTPRQKKNTNIDIPENRRKSATINFEVRGANERKLSSDKKNNGNSRILNYVNKMREQDSQLQMKIQQKQQQQQQQQEQDKQLSLLNILQQKRQKEAQSILINEDAVIEEEDDDVSQGSRISEISVGQEEDQENEDEQTGNGIDQNESQSSFVMKQMINANQTDDESEYGENSQIQQQEQNQQSQEQTLQQQKSLPLKDKFNTSSLSNNEAYSTYDTNNIRSQSDNQLNELKQFASQGHKFSFNSSKEFKRSLSQQSSRSNFSRSVSFSDSESHRISKKRQKSFDDIDQLEKDMIALPLLEQLAEDQDEQEDINYFQKVEEDKPEEPQQPQKTGLFKFFHKKEQNQVKPQEQQNNTDQKPALQKQQTQKQQQKPAQNLKNRFSMFFNKKDKNQQEKEEEEKRLMEEDDINIQNPKHNQKSGSCKCQMLRSASQWSLGLQEGQSEKSIQIAYIEMISKAKHYIYIENQFFISNTAGGNIKNKIAQALVDRIKLAAERKEKFKVVVFMPLLPGFEGEVNGSNSAVMKCQLHWEFNTISRGGQSILEVLQEDPNIEDPDEYISFYGLRTHAKIDNVPVTEIIYIHSKLMIVDDNQVIIGSANINDRSLQGTRDSEVCMVVEDQHMIPGKINGKPCEVGEFSATFRKNLYMEHFGLTQKEAMDPLCPFILQKIKRQTHRNTEIYRDVFACYPDDTCETLSQFEQFSKCKNLDKYDEVKKKIKGFAVVLPVYFLRKENLNLKITNKEYLVPSESFT